MKKILNFLNYENLKNICIRFPVLVMVIIITSILLFLDINGSYIDNYSRFVFSLIIVFFLSLGVYITSESYNLNYLKRNIYQIIPILFGLLFFYYFKSDIWYFRDTVFFVTTLFGIISYVFFAAYLKKDFLDQKNEIYFNYFYKISVIFLTSSILGLVLFGLGSIGITAVFALFELSGLFSSKFYGYWAILSLVTITPLIALYQVPDKEKFYEKNISLNSFAGFLIKYIATPFIYIYFIILYLYSIKVLANFGDWPRGEVSWLVILFSTFGYIIYIFSYPFRDLNKLISLFRKYFPYVVIPQIFMLFYAIYLRIAQYDLTINRYLVVIFGIWLTIISLYLIFSKKKFLGFIPLVITFFTIIFSVGPWSIYNLPEKRQIISLKNNLEKVNILVNGNIVLPENQINTENGIKIYSQISYLCYTYDCKKVEEIFSEIVDEFKIEHKTNWEKQRELDIERFKNNPMRLELIEKNIYTGPNNWEIIEEITKKIKVKNFYEVSSKSKYIYISSGKSGDEIFPLDIKGYEKILSVYGERYGELEKESSYIKIDVDEKSLFLVVNNTNYTKDLEDFLQSIYEKYNQTSDMNLDVNDLTYEFEIENYEIKLILSSISIVNPEYDSTDSNYFYSNVSGYGLLKEKNFD